jgi:hypothetical protein
MNAQHWFNVEKEFLIAREELEAYQSERRN